MCFFSRDLRLVHEKPVEGVPLDFSQLPHFEGRTIEEQLETLMETPVDAAHFPSEGPPI